MGNVTLYKEGMLPPSFYEISALASIFFFTPSTFLHTVTLTYSMKTHTVTDRFDHLIAAALGLAYIYSNNVYKDIKTGGGKNHASIFFFKISAGASNM